MIRAANPSDADAIAAIHVAGWRAAYAGIMPAEFLANLSIPERAAGWRRRIERDSVMVQLFEDSGSIRGWIASGMARENGEANEGEVYALYVDPSHWRRSIGGALIQHAELKLWTRGFQSIDLWVLEQNNLGRAFYAKCGYVEHGEPRVIDISETKLVELRLRKKKPNQTSVIDFCQ